MRKSYIIAALLALSFPAFATNNDRPTTTNNVPVALGGAGGHGGAGGQGGRGGTGVGVGIAAANATAIAAQRQRQTQRQTATGGNASAQGGNQTVTVSGVGSGDYNSRDRLQAPSANAPAIWSNNPCVVALSGGVSVAGFGASIGAGIEDRDCTRRANAQHLTAMGERDAAREVLCESTEVRAAFRRIGRPCQQDAAQAPVVQAATTPPAMASVAAPAPSLTSRQMHTSRPGYCGNLLSRGLITDECR